ncbi:hypothetical protein Godav_002391, partial [Gossypium davidsonii]|nr:hypothetical protein [Gossypium davidsonii]MBA0665988.1 hypothetical protein [Gossypium klotzschianum]
MDAKSSEILWSIVDPSNSRVSSPVTIANGIGATVYDGMSVSNGCIYVVNGYKVNVRAFVQTYSSGTSLFAFCVTQELQW